VSCIAGLFHRGGDRIDCQVIGQMLARMKARAPDGDQLLCDGHVGFGQAFLRTGTSSAEGPSHLSLDGQVWITADARIDGRSDLLRQLRAAGHQVAEDAPHADLVVHAYKAFGDRFLDHLIGDFAFALWDARRHKLICARDHFGVRPFYYFQTEELFGFSSDIDALLALPQVSRQLDDRSIADFLLFGACVNADQTIYKAIRCLPPASRMDVTRSGATQTRYWELPRQVETRYATRAEYVERFHELFEQAVNDRLPEGPVALQLSGGMDSTAIAAVAAARPMRSAYPVTGYHLSCNSALPEDDEGIYAQMVADHLGIPMVVQDVGDYPLFARGRDPALCTSFPLAYPHLAVRHDTFTQISQSGAHVLLSGYSGDAAMMPSGTYYSGLLRRGRLLKLGLEVAHHVKNTRSIRGMSLRTAIWSKMTTPQWKPPMPDWIDSGFADRLDLASRWEDWWAKHQGAVDAHRQFRLPWIQRQFEADEILRLPVLARYPFHDIRLVLYLLSMPNFMLAGKAILREAMRGRLPEPVRVRPKTALSGDPVRIMATNSKLVTSGGGSGLPEPLVQERFAAAWERYRKGKGAESTWASWLLLMPIALGDWLAQQELPK
jgi:asparagine synthase (glutamine-hydrolysing)